MFTVLYAQPYDTTAIGFYFRGRAEYARKQTACRNDFGAPVEEFEIQFIDGDDIDAALADAWTLNQSNFPAFLKACDDWDEDGKLRFIIAVGACGCRFDPDNVDPDDFALFVFEVGTLEELAEQFVHDGLYGEIPANISFYIDYAAISRDLAHDYAMIEIAGRRFAYACR